MNPTFLILLFLLTGFSLHSQNTLDPNGKKQGLWVEYHPNGKKKYEGHYVNNNPVGVFKNYDLEAVLVSTLEYKDQKEVQATFYHENGVKKGEGLYKNKYKHGTWKFFDKDTNLISLERYFEGKKNGISTLYYKDGIPAQVDSFYMDKRYGQGVKYFPDGKIKLKAHYVNDAYEGEFREYYSNGNHKTAGQYFEGVKVDKWLYYNEDGTVYIKETYNKGTRTTLEYVNGEFKTYYEKSPEILKEICRYKNGKKEGPFFEFYEKGEWKYETVTYENSEVPERAPEQVKTFVGEVIKRRGSYENGLLEGPIQEFNEQGEVIKTTHYKKGIAQ